LVRAARVSCLREAIYAAIAMSPDGTSEALSADAFNWRRFLVRFHYAIVVP
jgi:hypothetical protein